MRRCYLLLPFYLFLWCQVASAQSNTDFAADGSVRLGDRVDYSGIRGRVEFFRNGQWGTVCDDSWSWKNAAVVCRQLGYGDYVSHKFSVEPGAEHMPIHLNDVECSGREDRLADCSSTSSTNNCDHSQDAGVYCREADRLRLRLANGSTYHEGRVEIWDGWERTWGVLRGDIDSSTINVICKQLGHKWRYTRSDFNKYGLGSEQASFRVFICDGNENRLSDCTNGLAYSWDLRVSPWTCSTLAIDCAVPLSVGGVIGLIILALVILCCCSGGCIWMYESKYPKKRRETARPAATVSPARTTIINNEPQVHPPPTAAPAPISHEMDKLLSYNEAVAAPVRGYPPQQAYPQQPYPQQQPYSQHPYPQNSEAAAYPPQPVHANPAYPPSPNQPPTSQPPPQGDTQAYPQQPPVALYPQVPSVAPYPPEPSADPHQPPPPDDPPAPAQADSSMAQLTTPPSLPENHE